MAHSYPIWIDIHSCAYKHGNKSYGIIQHGAQNIYVGKGARNSHRFVTIELKASEKQKNFREFKLFLDDVLIRQAVVEGEQYRLITDKLHHIMTTPKAREERIKLLQWQKEQIEKELEYLLQT